MGLITAQPPADLITLSDSQAFAESCNLNSRITEAVQMASRKSQLQIASFQQFVNHELLHALLSSVHSRNS